MITLGKKGDQQALRGDRRALQGPQRRLRYGDSTPVAVIELVDRDVDAKGKEDRARHEAAQPASEAAA